MEMGLENRKAIVCGASKGLGYGCAKALVQEGVDVVVVARTPGAVDEATARLNAMGPGTAMSVSADVTTEEGRARMLEACPTPDILVNNAGGPPPGDFRSWGREEWLAALDANMLSAIELIKAVVDGMLSREFGRIVNITSHAVKEPVGFLGLSNGARAGLTGFTAGLARDIAGGGVTVNNLLPGQFDTDRLKSNHNKFAERTGRSVEDFREQARKAIPVGRFGNPDEFGACCAFLCSQHAGFLTGQNLVLDGGQYRGIL